MTGIRRKIAVGRCYGNPIPRRSGREGAGDPTSFAYVRHNFMRAGLEIVDCPHLTSQFKNSSDIRIACDVRDYLDHSTHFNEFIILSGDADFTPVLLSLRSHNRQTVIYTNDYTSPYYKAFSDGRIREEDLIRCVMQPEAAQTDDHPAMEQQHRRAPSIEAPMQQRMPMLEQPQRGHALELPQRMPSLEHPQQRGPSLEPQQRIPSLEPQPRIPSLEPLAPQRQPTPAQVTRPTPATVTAVADASRKRRGAGSTDAAIQSLIDDFKLIGNEILELVLDVVDNSEKPVPLAYLADRAQKALGHPKTIGTNWAGSGGFLNFLQQNLPEALRLSDKPPHFVYNPSKHRLREEIVTLEPQQQPQQQQPAQPAPHPVAAQPAPETLPARPREPGTGGGRLADLQRSITRIYEACQAPPLPPSEYQLLFTLIASEVRENGFAPNRSSEAVVKRAAEAGLKLGTKDVAFVIDAVDELDPWLEHTRSPAAVARAYRDYVLARCTQAGVDLTEDERQLIQVWFGASQWTAAGGATEQNGAAAPAASAAPALPRHYGQPDLGIAPQTAPDEIPLSDYGYQEPEPAPPPLKNTGLRYSFLKHG